MSASVSDASNQDQDFHCGAFAVSRAGAGDPAPARPVVVTASVQAYLGHRNIQRAVRYTEL